MLNFGCSEVEICEVFGDQLRNLHTWAVEEASRSLVVRSLKVWRSFGISCFFLCYDICVGGEWEGF